MLMMSNMGHIMTLANSIIGVGILAMPFCFYKCGIILSIFLLVLNYLVTRISCNYLIKSALLTRRRSFEYLGFYAFGSSGKLMVELFIIGYLIGTCIAYFVVVGDLGPRIIGKILDLDVNDNLRTWVMIAVTILCIIPLGLLKNVDSLSAVSTASIGFYICLVLKVISESQLHLTANDWHDKVVYWDPDGILQCLPIFSMACSCQMQLFEVMETVPNQSLEKMNSIVKQATKICTTVYVMVGLFGYIGFCTIPFTGNILIHFSQTLSSEVIKMGFVLSVAFSFPLVIFPCRVSIYSLIYKRGHGDASTYIPERRFKTITISIVLIALIVALMIPSIELVIGLVGSTIGVAICVMFPASLYLKLFSKAKTFERSLAQIVLIGGFVLMILGTYANLNAIDEKRSGVSMEVAQESHIKQNNMPLENIADKIAEKELEHNLQRQLGANLLSSPSPSEPKIKASPILFENPPIKEKSKLPVESPKLEFEDSKILLERKKIDTVKQKMNENIQKKIPARVYNQNQINSKEQLLKSDNINDIGNVKKKTAQDDNIKEIPLEVRIPNVRNNNIIDKDAIKKEDEMTAEEAAKDKKLAIVEGELKKANEMLAKKVDELKEEIVKQNQETQKLVNEKLSDIMEKVNEIKEDEKEERKLEKGISAERNNEKILIPEKQNKVVENLSEVDLQSKFNAAKGSLVAQLSKKTQETLNSTDYKNNNIPKLDTNMNLPLYDKKNLANNSNDEIELKQKSQNLNNSSQKNKVYEPLSYKTGEILNKINETKSGFNENRIPIPLPLLMNSTNNNGNDNKIKQINELPIINKQSHNLLNTTNIKNNINNSSLGKVNELTLTESNIEAIRRDILEVKESENDPNGTLKREKRDLKNFGNFNLSNKINENCLKNEPLNDINVAVAVAGLNNEIKMITGARDLKSIKEINNEN